MRHPETKEHNMPAINTPGYSPPNPKEIRAILGGLGLTQEQGARLIGCNRRAMARYVTSGKDSTDIPYPYLFTLLARGGWGMIHPDTWRHQIAHKLNLAA